MRETRDQVMERLRNRQELPKDREAGYSIHDCPNCSEPVWFWSTEALEEYKLECRECGYAEESEDRDTGYITIKMSRQQCTRLPASDFPASIEVIRKVRGCLGRWTPDRECDCDFSEECKNNPDHRWRELYERRMEIERQWESRGCEWEIQSLCPKCKELGEFQYGFFWHGKDGLAHYWCGWCGHEEAYNDHYDYFGETISIKDDRDDFAKAIGITGRELWQGAKAKSKRNGKMIRIEE